MSCQGQVRPFQSDAVGPPRIKPCPRTGYEARCDTSASVYDWVGLFSATDPREAASHTCGSCWQWTRETDLDSARVDSLEIPHSGALPPGEYVLRYFWGADTQQARVVSTFPSCSRCGLLEP